MSSWSDRPDCWKLLQEMVKIDSINYSISRRPFPERELAAFLESHARANGLNVKRLPVDRTSHNLLITAKVGRDAPWVVFDSHLDTVGVEGMSVSPFAGEIQGRRMYGRGVCDTKASGAAMLTALARATKSSSLGNHVAVLLTTDEEAGKSGAIAFRNHIMTGVGWKPEMVVVGEPTRMQPMVAHNGLLRLGIETKGKSVHSSRPELGRSAITDMLKVIAAIEGEYAPSLRQRHPLTGAPRCSVNKICGGSQFNVIPGSCRIDVDRRVIPGENLNAVRKEFESLFDTLRQAIPGLEVQIVDSNAEEPMVPLQTEAILEWLTPALNRFQLSTEPLGAPYGTNAGTYTGAGWPAVVLGPGDIAQAHTADEWIDLNELDLATDIYTHLMQTPFSIRKETNKEAKI